MLLAVLFTAGLVYLREDGGRDKWRLSNLVMGWRMTLFVLYLAVMLISTVFARGISNPYHSVWSHFGFRDDVKWNNEIIENILLFIPYTICYLNAFQPARPALAALKASLFATLLIEGAQLLFWLGEFQFSDIVHNVLGGMIGYGLWHMAGVIRRNVPRGAFRRWLARQRVVERLRQWRDKHRRA